MKRHAVLSLWTFLTAMVCFATGTQPLYPEVADTSHASNAATSFFHGYFIAKSQHNATSWLTFFHSSKLIYYDATLGIAFGSNRSQFETVLPTITQTWTEESRSYPLRILGDTTSAVVHLVDTPGMFGGEGRGIAAVDFLDGKVTRQVDYWDGRGNSLVDGAVPDNQYPDALGLDTVGEQAPPVMNEVARELNDALAKGNATKVAALFSADGIFEDMTLRSRLEGRFAIERYLQRALSLLPYGPGTTVSHVLGSVQGGGYEWRNSGKVVRNGLTSLELDSNGEITRLTALWDGSRINATAIQALAVLSVEP